MMCVHCSQRPEEGVRFPAIAVTSCCEVWEPLTAWMDLNFRPLEELKVSGCPCLTLWLFWESYSILQWRENSKKNASRWGSGSPRQSDILCLHSGRKRGVGTRREGGREKENENEKERNAGIHLPPSPFVYFWAPTLGWCGSHSG